jgi:hypothetical protein
MQKTTALSTAEAEYYSASTSTRRQLLKFTSQSPWEHGLHPTSPLPRVQGQHCVHQLGHKRHWESGTCQAHWHPEALHPQSDSYSISEWTHVPYPSPNCVQAGEYLDQEPTLPAMAVMCGRHARQEGGNYWMDLCPQEGVQRQGYQVKSRLPLRGGCLRLGEVIPMIIKGWNRWCTCQWPMDNGPGHAGRLKRSGQGPGQTHWGAGRVAAPNPQVRAWASARFEWYECKPMWKRTAGRCSLAWKLEKGKHGLSWGMWCAEAGRPWEIGSQVLNPLQYIVCIGSRRCQIRASASEILVASEGAGAKSATLFSPWYVDVTCSDRSPWPPDVIGRRDAPWPIDVIAVMRRRDWIDTWLESGLGDPDSSWS